ncbi:hypothetical protein, partial [Leptospira stimsonii]
GLDTPYEYQERIKKENRCIRKAGREDIETYYYCPKLIVDSVNSKKIMISLNENTDLDLTRNIFVYFPGFSLAMSTSVPFLAIIPPIYFGLIHYTNRVDIEVSK